jgi:lipopolysaccharide biosynthesis protein
VLLRLINLIATLMRRNSNTPAPKKSERRWRRVRAAITMIERQISTTQVEEVLLKPDGRILQSQDKVISYREFQGRKDNSIAIVAVERDGNFEVVTVMVNLEVKK